MIYQLQKIVQCFTYVIFYLFFLKIILVMKF